MLLQNPVLSFLPPNHHTDYFVNSVALVPLPPHAIPSEIKDKFESGLSLVCNISEFLASSFILNVYTT